MTYKCACPGNARGCKVSIPGNYAKKCDYRIKNGLDCNFTSKAKANNVKHSASCSFPGGACGLLVKSDGTYGNECSYQKENDLPPCGVTGKMKAVNEKKESNCLRNEGSTTTSSAPGIRSRKNECSLCHNRGNQRCNCRQSCGAPSYGGVDNAPNVELALTLLTTKARPSRSKSGKSQKKVGRIGSIVTFAEGGLNYDCYITLRRSIPNMLAATLFIQIPNQIKDFGGGTEMTGSNSSAGPFKVCFGVIIHHPNNEADGLYPNARIWPRTLPVRNSIFKDDLRQETIHKDLVVSVSD
ncbi:hypothetical protein ACHAW5_002567 [Stephanodiscus triporus]|uniref:Uncharacterized protein n=1 Tax=Stephanodiscus triporus TaxID=2934178 RepID=A0ABD3MW96_9STRA